MTSEQIRVIIARHRAFFDTGRTMELSFRKEQLRALRKALVDNEPDLLDALRQDLGKPAFEGYAGDVAITMNEIDHALRHLRSWCRPRTVWTPLAHLPARCSVAPEPFGVALVIGPWNFPVQLVLAPLLAALAAGNCVVVKPSPLAPATTGLIRRVLEGCLSPGAVSVIEGGAETAQMLLAERFDHIFFTGGTATGKHVMQAAAQHLTPVTLELGGKNPCIVDRHIDLDVTARRIVWGKFYNAGQSCVAVDHLLADRRIKDALVSRIVAAIRDFYGTDPAQSPDFGRIVNAAHVDRLAGLLTCGRIVTGGSVDRERRYVAPTVIDGIGGDEPVMEDEIFGPLLPVMAYDRIEEAISYLRRRPRPLALYVFSRDRGFQEYVRSRTSSGGVCVN
ncbi:MAG TPA: aldehyde dehydrogenase family protein, partial [Candidatus Deferrimicrobiaceae bacterium]